MKPILCALLAALLMLFPLAPVRAAEQEPLVRAAADITEPTLYYCYAMIVAGEGLNARGLWERRMDPRAYSLLLRPDGTGSIRLGDENTFDIQWTEDAITVVDGETLPYAWQGSHILLTLTGITTIEFAPAAEVEALLAEKAEGLSAFSAFDIPAFSPEAVADAWSRLDPDQGTGGIRVIEIDLAGGCTAFYPREDGTLAPRAMTYSIQGDDLLVSDEAETLTFRYDTESDRLLLVTAAGEAAFVRDPRAMLPLLDIAPYLGTWQATKVRFEEYVYPMPQGSPLLKITLNADGSAVYEYNGPTEGLSWGVANDRITLFAPNGAPLDLQLAFAEGVIHLYMNLNGTPATFLFERTAN